MGEHVNKILSILEKEPAFTIVGKAADELGVEAYVVGGFVRDIFLGRPSKDLDFVCVGSGIALAEKVANSIKGKSNLSIFKNFGTAQVKWGEYELEFVGARKESYRSDSRKPLVEDGTLQDDQNRRDFTINAMAICLNKKRFGELVDPFNGIEDLRKKTIRTPLDPDITFSDDPLRIMRGIRFAAQLGFDIAPDTMEGITRNAHRLEIVSMERVTDELNKIILSNPPSYGFQLMFHAGVLKFVFPEMVDLYGVEVINGKAHKDNFFHTLKVLDNVSQVTGDLWLRWAAIMHDIAKPATKRFNDKVGWTFHGHEDRGARMVPKIFRRMRLPMDLKMKYVQKLVRLHLRPIALVKREVTDSAIRRLLFEAGDDVEDLMKLCKADITSKDHNRVQRYLSNFELVEQKMAEVEGKDHVRNFQPPVSGEMIMEAFGIPPSKPIGEIKEVIKEAIMEGDIRNEFEPAYELMLKTGLKMGLKPVKELKNQ
ncbi:MAG: HD domain-containing protein [Imperialibacter sp.]|uniref:CCA tRNA nucleotidyltransferase n=1 Tax=Imperialibacter sp. TaxID=2038411 RepID=UPI0032F08EE7